MPHTTAGKSFDVTDTSVQRALQDAETALRNEQSNGIGPTTVLVADLAVGTNKLNHNLGRKYRFASVMPSVSDATFAWSIDNTNPVPELQLWIDVVGVAQPACTVWMF